MQSIVKRSFQDLVLETKREKLHQGFTAAYEVKQYFDYMLNLRYKTQRLKNWTS